MRLNTMNSRQHQEKKDEAEFHSYKDTLHKLTKEPKPPAATVLPDLPTRKTQSPVAPEQITQEQQPEGAGEDPDKTDKKKKEDLDKIIQRNLFKEFSNNEIEEMGLDDFNLNLHKDKDKKKAKKKKRSHESNYWRNRNDVNYRKIR